MSGDNNNRSDPLDAVASRKGITVWMARHEWSIVGALGFFAFFLGCVGYFEVMDIGTPGSEYSWWDPVYASMQLFIFEGPDATAGWPIYLQTARALAPLVLLYTAAVAIFKQVETEVSLYRLHFRKRRFVLVCGIGEVGYRVARDYCENTDKSVVIIDRKADNPLVAELSRLGAITITGNVLDPVVLLKSRAMYAKDVFLCTDDDQTNISCAKTVERLSRRIGDAELLDLTHIASAHEVEIGGEPASTGLRAFICVDAPNLYEVFSNHPFFNLNSERFSTRMFNRGETIARKVFSLCAPDMYYLPRDPTEPPMSILFVGFGALTRELIVQTALTAHYPDYRVARVTVLCKEEVSDLVPRFFHRYPHLEQVLELEFVYDDAMTLSRKRWKEMQKNGKFAVAYVALGDDVEGILTARRLVRLNRLADRPPLNFVVCLNQQTFLADIIDDDFLPIYSDKSKVPAHAPIEYLETLDETISIDVIVNEVLDSMARSMHNDYVSTLQTLGETHETNASVTPWSLLPAHKKKANQHAAAHMPVKLRCSDCRAVPKDQPGDAVSFPLDEENMEMLAQLEHRRWLADKYLAGYSHGKVRDEDHMLHPDLIPWEELSETDRDKDRSNIRQIPDLMAMQELKICRVEPAP
jgi:hypothetical protein